jgi:hypothetical protein
MDKNRITRPIRLAVRNLDAHRTLYTQVLGLPEEVRENSRFFGTASTGSRRFGVVDRWCQPRFVTASTIRPGSGAGRTGSAPRRVARRHRRVANTSEYSPRASPSRSAGRRA